MIAAENPIYLSNVIADFPNESNLATLLIWKVTPIVFIILLACAAISGAIGSKKGEAE